MRGLGPGLWMVLVLLSAQPLLGQVAPPVWIDESGRVSEVDPEDPLAEQGPDPKPADDPGDADTYPEHIDSTVLHAGDAKDQPPPPPPPPDEETEQPKPEKSAEEDGKKAAGKTAAGVADAKKPVKDVSSDEKKPVEEVKPFGFGSVEDAGDVSGQVFRMWSERAKAIQEGKPFRASERLAAIIALLRKLGGEGPLQSSMNSIGVAVSREARRALELSNPQLAVELAESAVVLAPHSAPVHGTLLRARFSRSPLDLQGNITALRGMAAASVSDMNSLVGLLLTTCLLVMLTVCLGLLVISLILLLRSGRLLAYDIHLFLPRGVSVFQTTLLVAVCAVLPILFRLGPLFVVFWWLLLCWAYLSSRERRVVAALWALTLLVPLGAFFSARLLGADCRDATVVFTASRDVLDSSEVELQEVLSRHPDEPYYVAAQAVVKKRTGDLKAARKLLVKAISLSPRQALFHNNLGNVLALDGDLEGALAEYRRATELQPDLVEGHFNIANLFFRQRKMPQAQDAAAVALNVDKVTFERFQQMADSADGRSHNRIVADVNIPLMTLLSTAVLAGSDSLRYEKQTSRLLFFGLDTWVMAIVIAVGLVLLVLFGSLLPRLRPSHACPRCGQPAGTRANGDIPNHDVCSQCYYAFLAPSRSIDASLKIRKEIEVRRFGSRRGAMRRALSVVVAGSGHLLAGAPVRGVLGLLLLSAILGGVLFIGGIIPAPFVVVAGLPLWRIVILVLLFLLLSGWALFSISRIEA